MLETTIYVIVCLCFLYYVPTIYYNIVSIFRWIFKKQVLYPYNSHYPSEFLILGEFDDIEWFYCQRKNEKYPKFYWLHKLHNIKIVDYDIDELKKKKEMKERFDMLMEDAVILSFIHGSAIYGTNDADSDIDVICVVKDIYEKYLDDGYGQWFYQDGKYDYQFISESTWIKKIENQDIEVFEAFSLNDKDILSGDMNKYRAMMKFDAWTMRQSLSGRCNNSWAKAHKKMTVEEDYDIYIAKKSLFHSIRIFDFGRQIAQNNGIITDFSSMNWLWSEIKDCAETDWLYYKKIYKPVYNKYRSDMVEYCPKPV